MSDSQEFIRWWETTPNIELSEREQVLLDQNNCYNFELELIFIVDRQNDYIYDCKLCEYKGQKCADKFKTSNNFACDKAKLDPAYRNIYRYLKYEKEKREALINESIGYFEASKTYPVIK